ncbi:MAG: thiamine ABC transporter substrate-binding protein [Acidimicrobiia bacterium]|nr:thiamine ABC transporter substrate-binding protein [Acidimicrobiia bacterium]
MSTRTGITLVVVGLIVAACGGGTADQTTTTEAPTTTSEADELPAVLTIISHDSFAGGVTEETFAPFTESTGIEVEVLPAGDAGSMVNQAILTADNPVADVLFGVDDSFLSRAVDAGIFVPYRSPLLDDVPDELELDPEHRVTPIDRGDVCINYDLEFFSGDLRPPLNLEQLTNAEYADLLVVEHPGTSSPGLAFLLSTIAAFGEDGWQDYWRALVDNGVKVARDWDTAYYADSTWWGGDRPLVVSYASSPPAEVIFADPPTDEAITGVMDEGCYGQIEFAGILSGTGNEQAAELLIDYLLSPEFQAQVPLSWFVFPVNETVELPEPFVEHTVVPASPNRVDPALVEANRERWIEEWTEIVLP